MQQKLYFKEVNSMNKKMKAMILVVMSVFVAICCIACTSSYGKIEKALEEAGYEKIQSNEEAEQMQTESDVAVTVHLFSNKNSIGLMELAKLNVVIVFEFKATEDMKEFYEESSTMQGLIKDIQEDGSAEEFYNKLVEKGYANGNCLVISTNLLVANEVANIVKEA